MANPYNFTVTDTSPLITYRPFREGEPQNAWKAIFSNSPDSSYDSTHQSDNKASGTSLHSTSMQGASFEITFEGTGIIIYGTGTAGAYTTTLDKKDAVQGSPSNGMLAQYQDLAYKVHTLSLNVTQGQSLNMSSAYLTVGVGKKGANVKETSIDAINVNSDGSSFLNSQYFRTGGGQGTFNTNHDATGYSRIDTNNAGSTIYFSSSGVSALFVYGSCNYDHGAYSVSLSPSGGASTTTRTFNATSKWFTYDNLIYWETGLDRTQTYTVALTNLDEGKYFDVHSVRLLDGQGGSGSGSGNTDDSASGLSKAAVAGISVGVVVFIIAAIAAAFFYWRRRRHRSYMDRPTPASFSGGDQALNNYGHEAYIEPFTLPQTTQTAPSTVHSKLASEASSYTNTPTPYGNGNNYPPWSDAGSSSGQSTSMIMSASGSGVASLPPGAGTGKSTMGPPSVASRPVRQETDAGPAQQPHVEEEEVLPPGYNPAWSTSHQS